MVQPAELLQYLRMCGVTIQDAAVCGFGRVILRMRSGKLPDRLGYGTHVLLLFMNMSDLEPDILLC